MFQFRWVDQLLLDWKRQSRIKKARRWHLSTQSQPGMRVLEPRRVLNAAPIVPLAAVAAAAQPAQVVVNAGKFANDGKPDTFAVSRGASGDVVSVNGQNQQVIPSGSTVVIQGSDDADHVEIEFSNGNPLDSNTVQFLGAGGTNSLQLTGSAERVTQQFMADGTGRIVVDSGFLTYSPGVTVTDLLTANQRTFELDHTDSVQLSTNSTSGLSEVRSPFGHDVLFADTATYLVLNDVAKSDVPRSISIESVHFQTQHNLLIDAAKDTIDLSGDLQLNGGALVVSADVVEIRAQINASGSILQLNASTRLTIDASASIQDQGGSLFADASPIGALIVHGTLDVSNLNSGQVGGAIHLLGNNVTLAGAHINARGDAGGGTILIESRFPQSSSIKPPSPRMLVDRNTFIDASAITRGSGGRVTVSSDAFVAYAGTSTATGGRLGGDGGTTAISGSEGNFEGLANLAAPRGTSGTLPIASQNLSVEAVNGGQNPSTDFKVDATAIAASLATGTNVDLQANNDVTVSQSIIVNNLGNASGSFSIVAGRSITINSNIVTDNGNFAAIANQTIENPFGNADRDAGIAVITMASNATVDTGTGMATFHLGRPAGSSTPDSGDVVLTNIRAGSLQVINDFGQIIDDNSEISVSGTADFSGTAITIGAAGTSTNIGSLTFNSPGAVVIELKSGTELLGDNTAASLRLNSAGAITDGSRSLTVADQANFSGTAITVGGAGTSTNFGTLTLNSTGAVAIQEDSDTELVGNNTAGALSLSSAGVLIDHSTSLKATNNASFGGTAITIGGAGTLTTFGTLTFNSTGAVNIQEDSGTDLVGDNTAGDLILSSGGAISQTSGSVTATTIGLTAASAIGTSSQRIQIDSRTLAAIAGGGIFVEQLSSGGNLTIGSVSGISGLNSSSANGDVEVKVDAGDLRIDGTILAGTGSLAIMARGNVTQSASIAANELGVISTSGQVDLSLSGNHVSKFAASAFGDIHFLSTGPLTLTRISNGVFGNSSSINGVASTNGGLIEITAAGASLSDQNGDLVILQSVKSDGDIQLTGQHTVTVAANVGNDNTQSVTIATRDSVTGTAIFSSATGSNEIIGRVVNFEAGGGIGTGSTANFDAELETSTNGRPKGTQGNDINWNLLLHGNVGGVHVAASTVNIKGLNPGGSVGGDVWIDINPRLTSAAVELTPFGATGNVVITSGQGNNSGSIIIDSVVSGNHLLIDTDTGTSQGVNLYLGTLISTMPLTTSQPWNAIAIETDGTLHKINDLPSTNYQFAIMTENMLLLQLLPNTVNPASGTYDASTVSGLNGIYVNYGSFQVKAPFLSPQEAIAKLNQTNSVIATYGQSSEYGWNVTIVWGDAAQGTNSSVTYISQSGDATTPVTLSHRYPATGPGTVNITLSVAVDPSISLSQRTASSRTYFEKQELRTTVATAAEPVVPLPVDLLSNSNSRSQNNNVIPLTALLLPVRSATVTPTIVTDIAETNALRNSYVASNDIRNFTNSINVFEKRRLLTLWLIPEDGSDPQPVTLHQNGKTTKQFDLDILAGDQLLEQFKTLPDGRYRLDLYRTLGREVLDERTVLETVITNGLPSNPLDEVIEQLRRNLDMRTDHESDK